jgi:peroxiredoxin
LVQLRDLFTKVEEIGVDLVGISPDKPAKAKESEDKHTLPFPLLSDSSMEAARAFRVAYQVDAPTLAALTKYGVDMEEASGEKHHLLPVPAVFVVGKGGVIQFEYVNPDYKVRLHPDLLVAAARICSNDARQH